MNNAKEVRHNKLTQTTFYVLMVVKLPLFFSFVRKGKHKICFLPHNAMKILMNCKRVEKDLDLQGMLLPEYNYYIFTF